MHGFKKEVIKANKEIKNLINDNSHKFLCEEISIGFGGDISMRIDLLAEEIFIKHLSKFGNIFSEECGFIDNKSDFNIIIDPIDGSANFASNLPYFGTSVALKNADTCLAASVVNLSNGDVFFKENESFEKANLDKLIFQNIESNDFSKVGIFEKSYCSQIIFEKLKKEKIKYRSPGAIALSLAYAKEVDFVMYEGVMRDFDVEAGLFFCKDLYVNKREDFLLISKDKETFDRITQLI
ncbi:MAG: inositol monophosphatase [Epsilonproteobacteria bacterium]|nr:inositol monophosphatase [Campylobacterota bacterium]